jgi:hypothetical protein
MIFKAKPNNELGLNDKQAELVGTELARLSKRVGGATVEAIIEAARSPHNPLHGFFEWDDEKAAHAYRRFVAAKIVACVEVFASAGATPVVATALLKQEATPDQLLPLRTVQMSPEEKRTDAIQSLLARLGKLAETMQGYEELQPVAEQVLRIIETIDATQLRAA